MICAVRDHRVAAPHVLGVPNPSKGAILEFMRSGEEDAIWEGYIRDYKSGEYAVPKTVGIEYTAHGLYWSNEDVYNFERYDLELLPEFCEAVLTIMDAGD